MKTPLITRNLLQTILNNLILMNLLFVPCVEAKETFIWEKASSGISEQQIKRIISYDRLIYVLTEKGLYQKNPTDNSFRLITNLSLSAQEIHDAVAHKGRLYLATNKGVHEVDIQNGSVRQIFHNSRPESNNCQSIRIADDKIFVGTDQGLFVKEAQNSNWIALNGGLQRASVRYLRDEEEFLWAATSQEVYRIDLFDLSIQKVFSIGINAVSGESDETAETQLSDIKAFNLAEDLGYAFVATSQGIFRSNDEGTSWSFLSSYHLPSEKITSLLISKPKFTDNDHSLYQIFAGTSEGVFANFEDEWRSFYQGMEALKINDLQMIDQEVWAASDQGLFLLKKEKGNRLANTQRVEMAANEPTIQQVHQMVIHYADVDPEKIKQWRILAQKRAWYPDLSLGMDGGQDRTVADSVYGSSSGGGQQYVGPDDKSYGRDYGWDVSLSWDLGDVVWSDAQTSIDNRAKLMVELREDLLNQVTRLYFERRRVQMELDSEDLDETAYMENEMRVDELTALIDALTGGEFSRTIQSKS